MITTTQQTAAQQAAAEQTTTNPRQLQRYTQPLKLDRVVRLVYEPTAETASTRSNSSSSNAHCQGITFHLSGTNLSLVLLAQSRQQPLHIASDLLTGFRRYVLFDSRGSLQTGMNFLTFYGVGGQERALLETFIALDGDIIHKVSAECLEDERLAQDLTTAHYWLMQQLFSQLGLKFREWLDRLSWGGTVVTFGGYWVSQWQQFIQAGLVEKVLELVLTVGGAWLLKMVLQRFVPRLLPWIQRRAIRRLMS